MVQSGRTTVYSSSNVCVQGDVEFNWYDTSPGFSDHSAWVYTYAQTPGCGSTLVVPAGRIASKARLFKHTGSDWALVQESDWAFGGGGAEVHGDLTFEQAAVAVMMWQGAPPPWGPGWYAVQGTCLVDTGSGWEGHVLWSGNQYVASALKAASPDASPDEPSPPPWVLGSYKVNSDAATIFVPVVGPEGQVMTVGPDGPARLLPIWIGEVPPAPLDR